MRRKISLYIGDQLADISDQSFILFNYTRTDLTNPTAVKNGFTQQVTLPGTDNNNRIFGHIFRPDRRTVPSPSQSTGPAFDAITRTPFTIYSDTGEVLEEGYLKLDRVERKAGGPCSYVVTLYGGLGQFLYGITYDDQGEKLSLADLDFFGSGAPESELDFVIDSSEVQDAWDELLITEGSRTGVWSVLNFAPCYNGIPQNFQANKGLLFVGAGGALPTYVEDKDYNTYYPDASGYVVVNLPQGHTEWECKDLRSYLQRPVVSVGAVLRALTLPRNANGWRVNIDDIDTAVEFSWQDLWLTLPLLPDLGTYKQETGNAVLTADNTPQTGGLLLGEWSVSYLTPPPSGTEVAAHFNVAPEFYATEDAGTYYAEVSKVVSGVRYYRCSFCFAQIVAYDNNNVPVGASDVSLFGSLPRSYANTVQGLAAAVGYSPVYGGSTKLENGTVIPNSSSFDLQGGGWYRGVNLQMDVTCANVAAYKLWIHPYYFTRSENALNPYYYTESTITDQTNLLMPLWEDYDTPRFPTKARIAEISPGSSATYSTGSNVRSGVRFTKRMLLSGTCSPGEFLVSFCRLFGLALDVDARQKVVTVLRRNSLYQNTVEDLTKRVDRDSVQLRPVAMDAKWYEFSLETRGGEFATQYAQIQGRQYGIQRVNTGWGFDANTVKVLDGSVFKSCAAVLEHSKYWYTFTQGALYYPPVFLDTGATATYWDSAGTTYAVDCGGIPIAATKTSYNTNNPGYDLANQPRAQFHDADGKPMDGSGVLLLYLGQTALSYFKLTDDVSAMDAILGGPCWLLDGGPGVDVPLFSRYDINASDEVALSLDLGMPAELDIPSITYPTGMTIYDKCWKAYLGDLFDRDTKVMTCKVDLRGFQVGPDLLRRFWFYDGAVWVLNKITNYSLTTWDLAECEFIQVQDTDNYLNGQF